ncbi:MAG: sigma-70 family RNA polymerase sigma factor [Bacteroides sp.]|nr:sigma-70 family RNA polymerase sigma factor [Bacteroides sp.]
MSTDKVIWQQIKDGSESAFRQLYDENADWLYSYGMKLVGNAELVAESIQQVFVQLFEQRQRMATPRSVKAHLGILLKQMLHIGLIQEETEAWESFKNIGGDEDRFGLEVDIETTIVHSELEREQVEQLQREINGLTKQQREVIYLKYYRNFNSDEIAEMMGITPRTVYNTAYSALTRLRERLGVGCLVLIEGLRWAFA